MASSLNNSLQGSDKPLPVINGEGANFVILSQLNDQETVPKGLKHMGVFFLMF